MTLALVLFIYYYQLEHPPKNTTWGLLSILLGIVVVINAAYWFYNSDITQAFLKGLLGK